MGTTTYYNITLPDTTSTQDWGYLINRAISKLSETIAQNQKPAGINLEWGDKASGRYIVCTSTGIRFVGGFDAGLSAVKNLVVEGGTAFPSDTGNGQLFLRSDLGTMYARIAGAWVAIGAVTSGAVTAAGGVLRSDIGTVLGDKGNIPVYAADGSIAKLVPSANQGRVAVADSSQTTGWRFGYIDGELAKRVFTAKGQLFAGTGSEAGAMLAAGATDQVLAFDSAEATGLKWIDAITAAAKAFANKGELVVGTGVKTGTRLAAPTNGQVLVGNPAVPEGMEWLDQSELGSVPNQRTVNAANIFAHENFI